MGPGGPWAELTSSRMGVAGLSILAALVAVSAAAVAAVPVETFREWNDPESWISYPKTAVPAWVNLLSPGSIPEHLMLDSPAEDHHAGEVSRATRSFAFDYRYDGFPSDFIYEFTAEYAGSPLLVAHVTRPDGMRVDLVSAPLPAHGSLQAHRERVFSADHAVRKGVAMQAGPFGFDASGLPAEEVVFSRTDSNEPLKGRYVFVADLHSAGPAASVSDARLVVGGKAFGLMGTDELRRDLAVGLLWGTPLALFIGLAVAVASVAMGLLYGVYAGYRGGRADEAMMRLNDVAYALPALPFLIILSVTISNSIFVMVGFLMVFGWVGVAKVSRSMSLQIKARGFVDAAGVMGQRDSRIILRHVLPQLLPYAFASVAISVPAAITTEAGLSFLGLGDPTFPTWGQILHDADTYGAGARGLWWWIVPPGVMIAVTGLAFVFIGGALDAAVNPRLRR